jgi:hypothetical protein
MPFISHVQLVQIITNRMENFHLTSALELFDAEELNKVKSILASVVIGNKSQLLSDNNTLKSSLYSVFLLSNFRNVLQQFGNLHPR